MTTILLGIDLADSYARLLDRAESVARVYDARLRLVYVAPPDPSFVGPSSWPQEVRDGFATELKEEHSELSSLADSLRERGVNADSLMVRGHVADVLTEQIERLEPEMLILGLHKEGGLLSALGGGVVRGMLKRGKCPVLVVPLPVREDEPEPEEAESPEEKS